MSHSRGLKNFAPPRTSKLTKAFLTTTEAPIMCSPNVASRQSPVASRQSPVASRQSPVASRQSPVARFGARCLPTVTKFLLFRLLRVSEWQSNLRWSLITLQSERKRGVRVRTAECLKLRKRSLSGLLEHQTGGLQSLRLYEALTN